MKTKVYELIIKIQEEKKAMNKFPTHALYAELLTASLLSRQELNKVLNELYFLGMIMVGDTVNDKYITIKEA